MLNVKDQKKKLKMEINGKKGKVHVLRPGKEQEIKKENGLWLFAPSTITLVKPRDRNKAYIVDTGCFGESLKVQLLVEEQNLSLGEIKEVIITHNHPDHVGNVALFDKASIIMPDSRFMLFNPNYFRLGYSSEHEIGHAYPSGSLAAADNGLSLEIVNTPGHAGQDLSVLVNTGHGKIAVVGDLFWSEEDWKHDSEYLGLCVNPEMQKRSRDYIREKIRPDIVIPGHGPTFEPKY